MFKTWKQRAIAAEAQLAAATVALTEANEQLKGLQLTLADRAALISITRNGRMNRFMFVRNGQLLTIETMGTWDDDVDGWKKQLLERTDDGQES